MKGESFDNRTTTTQNEAKLDIKANSLWETRFNRTSFDVNVFNPHAKFCPRTIKVAYKFYAVQWRLKYEQWIVENEKSFNQLLFVTTGGAAPTASNVMSRLAFILIGKSEDTYAEVMCYIRTKVNLALLKGSVLCLRECHSGQFHSATKNGKGVPFGLTRSCMLHWKKGTTLLVNFLRPNNPIWQCRWTFKNYFC